MESLLSGGVPDLKGDHLPVVASLGYLYPLGVEIGSDSRFVVLRDGLPNVIVDDASLADGAVAQHHYFEDVVLLLQILQHLRS